MRITSLESGGAQIEHGREGDIEAEQAQLRADEVAVLAEEPLVAGSGDSGGGGHGRDEVAEAIDEAAFDIDGVEEGSIADNIGDAVEQRVYLCRLFDVAAKENGAGGPDEAKPRALGRAEFRSG